MKKLLIIFLLISCKPNAQTDLSTLDHMAWSQDLEFLVSKINNRFAGFTPALKEKFNSETNKIRAELPHLSTAQKIMSFAKLLAVLGDGHTEISVVGPAAGFRRLPLQLYYFGNDLRILGIDDKQKNALGSKLIKINGHPANEIFESLKPYMNAENDIEYITTAPNFMIIPEVLQHIGVISRLDSVYITIQKENGFQTEIALNSISLEKYNTVSYSRLYSKPPLYLDHREKGYWSEYLPDAGLLYINVKTLNNHEGDIPIKKFIKNSVDAIETQNIKKVVIDLRLCRGGNYNHILPLLNTIKKNKEINKKGQLFVITGRLTFSAAAVATLFFKDQTQAAIVGEVCRARPNWAENMEAYTLPHSRLNFDCTEKLKVHSPALLNRDRIPVDVLIPRSFELYASGRDEVMEYIMSHD